MSSNTKAGDQPPSHVKALIERIFIRCTDEDIDRVISRVMSVHPKAAAADEPFEYQMRGVGCIRRGTVLTSEFSSESGKTVSSVRDFLSQALAADEVTTWSMGTAAAMMVCPAQEIEYAYDCTLTAAIRVKAASREQADAILRAVLDAADCNGGAWPNGDPVLFEASLDGSKPRLYEINGEPVDDAGELMS